MGGQRVSSCETHFARYFRANIATVNLGTRPVLRAAAATATATATTTTTTATTTTTTSCNCPAKRSVLGTRNFRAATYSPSMRRAPCSQALTRSRLNSALVAVGTVPAPAKGEHALIVNLQGAAHTVCRWGDPSGKIRLLATCCRSTGVGPGFEFSILRQAILVAFDWIWALSVIFERSMLGLVSSPCLETAPHLGLLAPK